MLNKHKLQTKLAIAIAIAFLIVAYLATNFSTAKAGEAKSSAIGNATYFDGKTYVLINSSLSTFTFVAWVNYTKFDGIGVIASEGVGEGVHSTWYAGAGGEVKNVTACGVFSDEKVGNYTAGWRFAVAPFIGIGSWHQIACTYNGSYISIYIDGKFVNKTLTPYKVFGEKIIEIGKRTSDFYINDVPTQAYFNGYMKNVEFYSETLNPNQIAELYNRGIDGMPFGYVSIYMPMNGSFACFENGFTCNAEIIRASSNVQ
ncbi:MAG: LamG-like jellyroll fold domain-containing protein [Candidatus Micrarchaeia archaeon]